MVSGWRERSRPTPGSVSETTPGHGLASVRTQPSTVAEISASPTRGNAAPQRPARAWLHACVPRRFGAAVCEPREQSLKGQVSSAPFKSLQ